MTNIFITDYIFAFSKFRLILNHNSSTLFLIDQ